MPLDGNPAKYERRIATKDEFWSATPRERLAMLAYALRAPMPDGLEFRWHFPRPMPECGTVGCSLGLAKYLWGVDTDFAAETFHMTDGQVSQLFFTHSMMSRRSKHHGRGPLAAADMADAIDRYLTTGRVEP